MYNYLRSKTFNFFACNWTHHSRSADTVYLVQIWFSGKPDSVHDIHVPGVPEFFELATAQELVDAINARETEKRAARQAAEDIPV
jgi:hypothetical protein